MPNKGFWRALLSADTKLDAGDNARKPLKPLLGIGDFVGCFSIILPKILLFFPSEVYHLKQSIQYLLFG